MNTTASFLPEPSWSRRCSTETVFSIQGRETDFVQDSPDTDWDDDDEYEPVTGSEEEALISGSTSGQSDEELKVRPVVEVAPESGDLQLADSEFSAASDCERDLPRYERCVRCKEAAADHLYRFCGRCFKARKEFFPPRPRRKPKTVSQESSQECFEGSVVTTTSQDSGIESIFSQELVSSQDILSPEPSQEHSREQSQGSRPPPGRAPAADRLGKRKRRSESADRARKRPRPDSSSEGSAALVAPLVKAASDPLVCVEAAGAGGGGLCIVCLAEPKSGVFVHRRVAHICCCYGCALKVWAKARRCPVCNCKVSNVLKAVVM